MINLSFDWAAIFAAYGQYIIFGSIALTTITIQVIKKFKRRKNNMEQIETEALTEKAKQIWAQLQEFDKKEQEEVRRLQERFKAEKKILQDKYEYLYGKLGW